MSYTATLGTGIFTSGIQGILVNPLPLIRRSAPVIYCNSASAMPGELIGQVQNTDVLVRMVDRLTREGWTILAPDMDLTWGSEDYRIADAVSFAISLGMTDPPILIGMSHGAACALHYAAHNNVSCVVGGIPAIDVTTLRNNNTVGQKAAINAAWGLSSSSVSALPVGADPNLQRDSLSSVPIQLWVASDDPVSVNHASFASVVGAEDNDLGALGHSEAAMETIDVAQVAAFIADIVGG